MAKAKELAHHYRWRASKIAPRDYGDRTVLAGDPGGPMPANVDWTRATPEQLRTVASLRLTDASPVFVTPDEYRRIAVEVAAKI